MAPLSDPVLVSPKSEHQVAHYSSVAGLLIHAESSAKIHPTLSISVRLLLLPPQLGISRRATLNSRNPTHDHERKKSIALLVGRLRSCDAPQVADDQGPCYLSASIFGSIPSRSLSLACGLGSHRKDTAARRQHHLYGVDSQDHQLSHGDFEPAIHSR